MATTEGASKVVSASAAQVKHNKLELLRKALPNRTYLQQVKSLPKPLLYAVGGSTAFYLAHKLLAGPQSLTLEKNLTVC